MESDRRRRGLQHRRASARPLQDRCARDRCPDRRNQQGSKRAVSGGGPAGSRFQIGRASCRERVEISVVGVSLKKKKEDENEEVYGVVRREMETGSSMSA